MILPAFNDTAYGVRKKNSHRRHLYSEITINFKEDRTRALRQVSIFYNLRGRADDGWWSVVGAN